jgi:hypothetical protein
MIKSKVMLKKNTFLTKQNIKIKVSTYLCLIKDCDAI